MQKLWSKDFHVHRSGPRNLRQKEKKVYRINLLYTGIYTYTHVQLFTRTNSIIITGNYLNMTMVRMFLSLFVAMSLSISVDAWRSCNRRTSSFSSIFMSVSKKGINQNTVAASALVAIFGMFGAPQMQFVQPAVADPSLAGDLGANDKSNTKIRKGGASTLQQGISKSITRGVNLDETDFSGQNLKGVAFQQSIVRNANFKGCNLVRCIRMHL